MYKAILFILYIFILIFTIFFNIRIMNIPIQTILILISLLIGLFIFFTSLKVILFQKDYISLKMYFIYTLSFIIILIIHDYYNNKTEGMIKAISNLIYLNYGLILVHILNNKQYIIIIKKIFIIILIIYIIGYLVNFSEGEKINVFIFSTRTNLAWFLLFLYIVLHDAFPKTIKDIVSLIIFFLLLMNSSRGPILVFLLTNTLIYKEIIFTKQVFKYLLISSPVLIGILFMFSSYFSLAFERLSHIGDMNYRSSSGYRISVLFDGFDYASQYFFGNGYLSFPDIFADISRLDLHTKYGEFTADNSYIELLFDVGWVPLLILFAFFYTLYQSNHKNKFFLIYIASLMMFDSIYHNNFWILLTISVLIINTVPSKLIQGKLN